MTRLFPLLAGGALCCFLSVRTLAETPDTPPPDALLPVVDTAFAWVPLRRKVDPVLQKKLEERMKADPLRRQLIRKKKLAVALVNIADIYNPHAAWINGNLMMYAASMPKIAVLLAAMQALEDGDLDDSPALQADMNAMIRKSDNAATTRVIDRIGLDRIAAVLTSPEYELFDKEKGGGLWVGRRFAKKGKRNPDPLQGLSHAATVSQVARFYYLLATGRLVSAERSRQMLDIMSSPKINHKFVKSLKDKYSPTRIFRKSGTWRTWHSDSVLLWSKDGKSRYIIVAMADDPQGGSLISRLVPELEAVLGIVR